MQTLLCCTHTAELTKAKLMRGSYGTRARRETLEAVQELVGKVGVGFSCERFGQEVSYLILGGDIFQSDVACLHFLPEVVVVLD